MRKFLSPVFAASLVLSVSASAPAQLIVGSDSSASNLWSINIANSANNRDLGADARMYGLAANDATLTLYFSDTNHQLRSATYASTGAVSASTIIGLTVVAGSSPPVELTMQGLAFDSAASKLYGIALGSGVGGIYEISTEDASCTLVRALPGTADFPAFDYNPSDDSFYFCTNLAATSTSGTESYAGTSVYRLHKPLATSVATLVAAAPAGNYDGLAAIGNLLYLINNNNAGISVIDMFAGTSSTLPFTWGATPNAPFAGATWAFGSIPAPSGADISVTLTSPTPDPMLFPPGGNTDYTITVRNNGPNTSGTIILQDTIPTGMTFVSAAPGTWTNPSGTIRQTTIPPMASGASTTYTLTVTPTTTGTFLNKVYANNIGTAGAADARVQNNRAVWASIVRQPGADLRVTGTSPADCSVTTGGTATFTLSVANQGDIAAASTQLAVALPSNVSFVSSTPPLTPVGGVLSYSVGSLIPSGGAALSVDVVVNTGRSVQLVATATTTSLELNPTDNTAALATVIPGVAPTSAAITGMYTTVRTVNGLDNPTSIVPGLLDDLGNPVHFRQFVSGVGDVHINPGRPYASPNRSKFIQFWDTDHAVNGKRHILLRHDLSTSSASVVVQSGVTEIPSLQGHDSVGPPYYPYAVNGLAAPTFSGVQSINDAGNFVFDVAQDSRYVRPTEAIQSRSIIKSVGGTLSLVSQSTLTPAPAPYGTTPNANYLGGLACPQIAADNSVAFTAFNAVPNLNTWLSPAGPWLVMKSDGATIVAQVSDSTLTYPAPGILGSLSVWGNQLGGTTYPGKSFHTDSFYNTSSYVSWNADHSHYILSGLLNTAGPTTRGVVVVDGNVVVQDGQVLPGFSSPAWLLDGAIGSNIVSSGIRNNYRMEADGTWFVCGHNLDWKGWVMRNGSIIARSGDLLTPTSSLRWATDAVQGDRRTLYWACSNPRGDYAIYGRTTNSWTAGSGAIVLNGTSIVARTGDPVDLNGNGVFDDHYYISGFGGTGADGDTGEEVFMSNDALYVLATVTTEDRVLSCGAFTGSSFALVRIPLPLGACCAPSGACTLTSAAFCAAGYQGDSTACVPTPCPQQGVCCRGSTCNASVSQGACTAVASAGAIYVTSSGVCNAGGSGTTPCCHADFNKVGGIGVQDIFDFLTAWFAGSPFAIVGGNGATGTLGVQNIFDFLNLWFAGGC